jgi:hypothetical protein
MEYSSVRMLVLPDSTCVKTEKSVERSSLAFPTGTTISRRSPAGVTDYDEIPLSVSHSLTILSVSSVGFTKSAT